MLAQQGYEIDTFLLMRIMKAEVFHRGFANMGDWFVKIFNR